MEKATAKKKGGDEYSPAKRRGRLTPGRALKLVRELQDMTQNELAAKSGLDQSVISAMENERTAIGVERGRKLARALRVHPAVIVFSDWASDADSASDDRPIRVSGGTPRKHAASA
jgi:transcriptional regulator with XRE-family HTH domain